MRSPPCARVQTGGDGGSGWEIVGTGGSTRSPIPPITVNSTLLWLWEEGHGDSVFEDKRYNAQSYDATNIDLANTLECATPRENPENESVAVSVDDTTDT